MTTTIGWWQWQLQYRPFTTRSSSTSSGMSLLSSSLLLPRSPSTQQQQPQQPTTIMMRRMTMAMATMSTPLWLPWQQQQQQLLRVSAAAAVPLQQQQHQLHQLQQYQQRREFANHRVRTNHHTLVFVWFCFVLTCVALRWYIHVFNYIYKYNGTIHSFSILTTTTSTTSRFLASTIVEIRQRLSRTE
jgi:hypothetical protein